DDRENQPYENIDRRGDWVAAHDVSRAKERERDRNNNREYSCDDSEEDRCDHESLGCVPERLELVLRGQNACVPLEQLQDHVRCVRGIRAGQIGIDDPQADVENEDGAGDDREPPPVGERAPLELARNRKATSREVLGHQLLMSGVGPCPVSSAIARSAASVALIGCGVERSGPISTSTASSPWISLIPCSSMAARVPSHATLSS